VGWVLARMVDIDVPLDIAQYAEGQRFVAFFVLDQVQDAGKEGTGKNVAQYLCAMTEPHDGLPYDYDQIRVFHLECQKTPLRNRLSRARSERRTAGNRDE